MDNFQYFIIFLLCILYIYIFNFIINFLNRENYADQIIHASVGNIAGPLVTLPYDMDAVPVYQNENSIPTKSDPNLFGIEKYRNFAFPFTEQGERRFPYQYKNSYKKCDLGCPRECKYGCPKDCPMKCPGSSFEKESKVSLWN